MAEKALGSGKYWSCVAFWLRPHATGGDGDFIRYIILIVPSGLVFILFYFTRDQ